MKKALIALLVAGALLSVGCSSTEPKPYTPPTPEQACERLANHAHLRNHDFDVEACAERLNAK